MRVRQGQVGGERQNGHWLCELAGEKILTCIGIGKACRGTYLRGLKEWRCADGRLQWTTLARVVRLVEDAVRRTHQPFRITSRIPGQAHARGKCLLVSRNQARRHAGITRIEQARRSARHDSGLCAWNPEILAIVNFRVWRRQLISEPQVQGQT